MTTKNSPDWSGSDYEEAVSASIDDHQVQVSSRATPMDDYGEVIPDPDVVKMPLETGRELAVWLGERLGTTGKTVAQLEALLVGVRAELRHMQHVRDDNANALAQLFGTQYGHSFPRLLRHLEELIPYLRATSLNPVTARLLDDVLASQTSETLGLPDRVIEGLRAELAPVIAGPLEVEPEPPYSEPAEALRQKVIDAGRRIPCATGPLMPNGQPKNQECPCEPCNFRRALFRAYAILFRNDTIFERVGKHVERW